MPRSLTTPTRSAPTRAEAPTRAGAPTRAETPARAGAGSASTPLTGRIARYLDQPETEPTAKVVQLFEKASEIERAKLLDPVTQMVRAQVAELEAPYVAWQSDSTRAQEQAARYQQEAAAARRDAAELERKAENTENAEGLLLSASSGPLRLRGMDFDGLAAIRHQL